MTDQPKGADIDTPSEIVDLLYRGFLNRAPDPLGHAHFSNVLRTGGSITDLLKAFIESPEYRNKLLAPQPVAQRMFVPLGAPGMRIDWQISPEQLAQLIKRIGDAWTRLGEDRAYYSVLTGDEFLPGNLNADSIERFWASGVDEAAEIQAILARHGFSGTTGATCVEYGCGVGRVSVPLAELFENLHAYDISAPHLKIAREHIDTRQIHNVVFHQVTSDTFENGLFPCDFFYSRLVLQHNPPPIISVLIRLSLRSLRPGGIAVFQVPTCSTGYSFQIDEYLAHDSADDIEMHLLPQSEIIKIITDADCRLLEIREDGAIGMDGRWISNTFIVQKGELIESKRIRPKADANPLKIPDFLSQVSWHHSIEFPNGYRINGAKSLEVMKQQYEMTFGPLALDGKSVLDLGTWSGAFAVEAARRGASRVVSVDYVVWRPPFTFGREAFDFVVAASGFRIEGVELDLDASPLALTGLGEFDVVLFLGVFYHLRDPIAALREISKITREVLVVETYWTEDLPAHPPGMIFYPGSELGDDPTNWWAPNIACVEELLKTFGFSRVVISDGSASNRKWFHAYKN